ncbi:ParA family protein [Gracilibacillus thailandensis]|uniref:AAA family ATPase n=1 Tax=Gracilibacillus thailandensis TaxID=563735 RepID=A0A6N7QZB4_9BACI|nr:ParA family protein [Gracilibacillus thailandensis]MRI66215.1 AAA family ATPase [Gracilibacillus thailandensis]
MAKVISIVTHKGGTLKTSIATNVAGVLSQKKNSSKAFSRKNRVLIVDTDGQGNVGMSFGFIPEKQFETNVYSVLVENYPIQDCITKAYKSIDILGSNTYMIRFELDMLTKTDLPKKDYFNIIKKALEPIKDEYDYILIDTPPSLGLLVGNVLNASDEVIIPYSPEPYSVQSVKTIISQIESFQEKMNPDLKIKGIVGTLVDSRTTLHSELLSECRKYALKENITFYDTVIPKTIRFSNSIAYDGLPATLVDKKNKLVQSYYDLVDEMNL